MALVPLRGDSDWWSAVGVALQAPAAQPHLRVEFIRPPSQARTVDRTCLRSRPSRRWAAASRCEQRRWEEVVGFVASDRLWARGLISSSR